MRIISFIEDEESIKKILKHLNLWMTNHDPPENETNHLPVHIEWWETKEDQDSFVEDDYQAPYEDEYSQLTPYEDHIC